MSSDFRLPEMQKTSSDVRLPYGRRKREVFRLPGRSPEDGRRKWSGNPAFRLGRKISSFFKALFFCPGPRHLKHRPRRGAASQQANQQARQAIKPSKPGKPSKPSQSSKPSKAKRAKRARHGETAKPTKQSQAKPSQARPSKARRGSGCEISACGCSAVRNLCVRCSCARVLWCPWPPTLCLPAHLLLRAREPCSPHRLLCEAARRPSALQLRPRAPSHTLGPSVLAAARPPKPDWSHPRGRGSETRTGIRDEKSPGGSVHRQ